MPRGWRSDSLACVVSTRAAWLVASTSPVAVPVQVEAAADRHHRAAGHGDQAALVLRQPPHDAGRVDAQQGVRLARDEVEDDVRRRVRPRRPR